MKTIIIDENKVKERLQFPLLAKSKNGRIILFVNETTGTVLVPLPDADNSGNEFPGEYSDEWISCIDKTTWTIIDSITIQFTKE
ncbi:MAG: hypothetical protein WC827_03770 [Candidatus Paceibacterota bacterium]|jgi:hypothetical protein